MDKEHKLVGPFAMFNYFAGIVSGSDTRLDLVAIINDYNSNSLKDITLENYGREIERQGNCGDNDVEDMRMDGYNLITTKLVVKFFKTSFFTL